MKYIVKLWGETYKINPIQIVDVNSKEEALKVIIVGAEKNSKSVEHEPIIQSGVEVNDENFHIVKWNWARIEVILSVYSNSEREAIDTAKEYMDNHKEYKFSNHTNRRVHIAENSGTRHIGSLGKHWIINTKSLSI